jgi:hypothetical protein
MAPPLWFLIVLKIAPLKWTVKQGKYGQARDVVDKLHKPKKG